MSDEYPPIQRMNYISNIKKKSEKRKRFSRSFSFSDHSSY